MKPILFDEHATTFDTNGIGRLECTSAVVTEERNGQYELALQVLQDSDHASEIKMDSIIAVKPSQDASIQGFRVYKITKPIGGIFGVFAQHISYQLSLIPSMPFSVSTSSNTCASTLAGLKSNAVESCPFTFWTDVTTVAGYSQTVPRAIRTSLGGIEGSVLDQFGGEYEWDNWTVKLHKNRGVTTPTVTLAYGKNITDLEQEENISSTVTGVCPYWSGTVDEKEVVVTLPEKVIESKYADSYGIRHTIPLDLSSEWQEQPTVAQVRNFAQMYVNQTGMGIPVVSIKLSFVNLADTEEYKDVALLETVHLCDQVNVYFEKLDISTTAKVVKTVYNVLTEKYDSIEIGSVRTNLATTISSQEGAIETMSSTLYQNMDGKVKDIVASATSWLTSSGGYVVAVRNDDGSWKELLFMDTNDASTAKNVLRINENGIGFSSTGVSGPYTQAWTLDGKIVIGGTNVPSLTVYDSRNKILFQVDKDGMEWNEQNSSKSKNGTITLNMIDGNGKSVSVTLGADGIVANDTDGQIGSISFYSYTHNEGWSAGGNTRIMSRKPGGLELMCSTHGEYSLTPVISIYNWDTSTRIDLGTLDGDNRIILDCETLQINRYTGYTGWKYPGDALHFQNGICTN